MKVIKPLRLAAMNRPFHRDGREWLTLTAIAMTDLCGEQVLMPEPELWEMVAAQLGNDGVLDLSMPKGKPEFLVTGNAYTHHQADKRQCAVSIQVGRRKKALAVFGDRFWIDGRPSEPLPFESMRIDWRHAYGGGGHEENLVGIGHADEMINGLLARRVPNIEHPHALLQRPDQQLMPAGFGPVDMSRPSRLRMMGTQYDDHWKEHLFPDFSHDMDWQFFNAASSDQWLDEGDGELAGAPFEIMNMHPSRPVLRGTLPAWRARGFIVRGFEPPVGMEVEPEAKNFEGFSMRLTTAWFFPHVERVALVYHGVVSVTENDAEDVSHMMIALEEDGMPRALAHYWQTLSQRSDPEQGAYLVLDDAQLVPERAIGAWIDTEEDGLVNALERNMKERAARAREKMSEAYRATGGDFSRYRMPEAPLQNTPTLKEMPAFLEKTKALVREQQQKLEASRRTMEQVAKDNAAQSKKVGFDTSRFLEKADNVTVKGPPKTRMQPLVDGIMGVSAAVGADPISQEAQEELARTAQRSERSLADGYRRMAHHQSAADAMTMADAQSARKLVEGILAGDRDFSDRDLTGADFSGMDLSRTRWHRSLLESADFTGCNLTGSSFDQAVLVRAKLHRVSLRGSVLHGCNLSLASLEDSDCSGARLDNMLIEKLEVRRCDFSDATVEEIQCLSLRIEDCCFDRARITAFQTVEGCVFQRVKFDEAKFERSTLLDCELQNVSFIGARMVHCAWTAMPRIEGVDFSEANLIKTCFVGGTALRKAVFRDASMKDCSLREVPFDEADFTGARLDNSDFTSASLRKAKLEYADAPDCVFIRTDFTQASLVDANLQGALLQKAILSSADLRRANLFRADLSECLIDDRTLFDGAYTEQVVTTPKRKKESVA